MEVLRRCPLAIAQRLVHCTTAVSTAVLGSHKDNVRCTAGKLQELCPKGDNALETGPGRGGRGSGSGKEGRKSARARGYSDVRLIAGVTSAGCINVIEKQGGVQNTIRPQQHKIRQQQSNTA